MAPSHPCQGEEIQTDWKRMDTLKTFAQGELAVSFDDGHLAQEKGNVSS